MQWVLIRIASPLQPSLQPIGIVQVLHFVCFNCFSLILFSIFSFSTYIHVNAFTKVIYTLGCDA